MNLKISLCFIPWVVFFVVFLNLMVISDLSVDGLGSTGSCMVQGSGTGSW